MNWENIAIDGLVSWGSSVHGMQISETDVIIASNESTDTYRVDLALNKCIKDS